mmetsp:Transcript_2690/g.7480  ORF Transcript_2690/g.7480 Transcript_2690/m.7480 type:complete len:156 (-) Transcript_2690:182-649(-)
MALHNMWCHPIHFFSLPQQSQKFDAILTQITVFFTTHHDKTTCETNTKNNDKTPETTTATSCKQTITHDHRHTAPSRKLNYTLPSQPNDDESHGAVGLVVRSTIIITDPAPPSPSDRLGHHMHVKPREWQTPAPTRNIRIYPTIRALIADTITTA